MDVKDRYVCTSCGVSKSCFVFNEFVFPFALCMECFVKIRVQFDDLEPEARTCTLCDTMKDDVYPLKTQNNLLLNGILFTCKSCFAKVESLMQDKRYL